MPHQTRVWAPGIQSHFSLSIVLSKALVQRIKPFISAPPVGFERVFLLLKLQPRPEARLEL